jgi:hypothetical protein
MTIEISLSHDLNKGAAPDGVLCVGAGRTAFVGRLDWVEWHRHGAPVFIAGLAGTGEILDDLVDFARAGNGPPLMDPRVARVVEWLAAIPPTSRHWTSW